MVIRWEMQYCRVKVFEGANSSLKTINPISSIGALHIIVAYTNVSEKCPKMKYSTTYSSTESKTLVVPKSLMYDPNNPKYVVKFENLTYIYVIDCLAGYQCPGNVIDKFKVDREILRSAMNAKHD